MKVFSSTYSFKIDRKGRLSIPAPFRTALAARNSEGMLAWRAPSQPAIRVFPTSLIDDIAVQIDPMAVLRAAPVEVPAAVRESVPLAADSEGRVVLSDELIRHARLEDTALLVGMVHHFEIWNPALHAAATAPASGATA